MSRKITRKTNETTSAIQIMINRYQEQKLTRGEEGERSKPENEINRPRVQAMLEARSRGVEVEGERRLVHRGPFQRVLRK